MTNRRKQSGRRRAKIVLQPGEELIFRPYRHGPNGEKIWAKWYGLTAWPIVVKKS